MKIVFIYIFYLINIFFNIGGVFELSKKYIDIDKKDLEKSDIEKIQKLIEYHSDLYYNKQEPIISDFEYDIIYNNLVFLEKKYSIKNKKSDFVGSDLVESSFEKVKHSRPMISLDNTYNEEDLNDFDDRVKKNLDYNIEKLDYCLEYKFDGLGVELIYKNGIFTQAITRGNGIEGEDVTENVKQIQNIPKTISFKDHLEVRGEVVMPISVFNELNEKSKKESKKVFSNPRNAASGSLRMKDNLITKERKLKFFAYDLANFDDFIEKEKIDYYYDVIVDLEKLGFEISSYFKKFSGISEVISEIEKNNDIKKDIDFEVDGLVLKVNDINLWSDIGWTEHHPKYAIAYKFPAEILTTNILSIEHSVGRTGTITPVANLEAINIGGAIIRRATLHNYEEVENLDVRIGDRVFIKRAGEVIPKIISVIDQKNREKFEKIKAPEKCPSCNGIVKKDEGKIRFYCINSIDCPAQNSEKLAFAVGKQGFNIDGLGENQIDLFLNLGIIKNLIDIFNIKDKKDILLSLDGFKEKSVQKLINSVENAKKIEVSTFITALGIPGVGKKTSKVISRFFKSKTDFIDFSIGEEELVGLQDVGPELSKNIISYFSDLNHKKILSKLIELLDINYFKEKIIVGNSIFRDKKVCITGSFELGGKKISRDDLVKKLEEVGGSFVTSLSKNTDYLLAGEKAGSKKEKADKLSITIIDLDFFNNNI